MRQKVPKPIATPARGLLHRKTSFENFELHRFEPSAELGEWIEQHWMILHDLGDRPPYRQRNLSHPNQHVVIEAGGTTGIFGAASGVFEHVVVGTGRVFGTKFWPGAFRPFFGRAVSALTDTHLPLETVFTRSSEDLTREFVELTDPTGMAERLETMLLAQLPKVDEKATLARQIVKYAENNIEMISVVRLAETFGVGVRALQRLFDDYIGVTPKWVIDRYRMLEAVETMNAGADQGLTELAYRLGYFDQASFNHAFQRLTGEAPGRFVARRR
jgi:AraC-like DNA-binding protein